MIYAKYTIVLKTLLDDPNTKNLINEALSTYPLYTPEHESKFTKVMTRSKLNELILNHFKYREIGFETFGRWLDELKITMNEIMPYYNQKFISEDIINGLDDIFGNLDVTETFEEERSDTKSSEATNTGSESESSSEEGSTTSEGSDSSSTTSTMDTNSKNVQAKTPQSQLTIVAASIDNVQYADEVHWNKDHNETESETSGSTTSESSSNKSGSSERNNTQNMSSEDSSNGSTSHTLTRKGNQGVNTYAHDMLEFRNLFINIVQEIIKDPRMQELWMGVY